MKNLTLAILCLLLATPVFSQDKKKKSKTTRTAVLDSVKWKKEHYVIDRDSAYADPRIALKKLTGGNKRFIEVKSIKPRQNTDMIKKLENGQFGIQGDIQYRNFNLGGDLEQLLLRSGVTYKPKNTEVTFTLGLANITTGAMGESTQTTTETRIYQEALLPQKVGNRDYLTHRFRYEQRFVEHQDFRTRFRYNLFLNSPINKTTLSKNAIYAAFYNEIFINGEKNIGNNNTVRVFDRNRFYAGLGYGIIDR
ncbi:DUF2490 domain-containing protein [Flavobacterium sp.]|uniref:DUF2490 domain-containing protein n=1 Tax=Flavobacterium sp. TaxID=239 RepID=UPI00248884E5|nr:DUF2490 domain-containing protein [Flavobacterium sp.]MDI1316426.1 DUF2490 domain-containing protein [Flavobacterium sp.]